MSRSLRLIVCGSIVSLAGCGSDAVTSPPAEPRTFRPVGLTSPTHDDVPDSLGMCRAGYIVANGRCEPI
jgi:hypothetical protein